MTTQINPNSTFPSTNCLKKRRIRGISRNKKGCFVRAAPKGSFQERINPSGPDRGRLSCSRGLQPQQAM